ncbi:MAG TPA: hypothetical protein VF116_10035 [Ktedonobacterales bacterium]
MDTEHEDHPPDVAEVELSDLPEHTPLRADKDRRVRGARLLRRSTVFAALALVVVTLIYTLWHAIPSLPQGQATPTASAVARFLPPAGLGCVLGAAWDPTSTYIALVGTPDNFCGNGGYAPNVVNIYRARTASLVRQLRPDAAVFAALSMRQPAPVTPTPQQGPPPGSPQLTYQTLRWSPDGKLLALSFAQSFSYDPTREYHVVNGLVLIDPDGSHERVLVDRSGVSLQPAYTVWDLHAGTAAAVGGPPIAANPPSTMPNSLPLALSYTWNADGSLVASGAPLASGTQSPPLALDLVGNPIGGRSFGLWQPGQMTVLAVPIVAQQAPTYLYLFQSTFAAWSPDGRYFVDQLNMDGLLIPAGQPAPSQAVLRAVQLDQAPQLPVRDAALQQALEHDLPLPVSLVNNPPPDTVPLAWRPDGKVLAILTEGNGYILRAAATGQVLSSVRFIQLPPSDLSPPGAFGTQSAPLWSPDGTHLLLPSLALVDVGKLAV